MKDPDLRRCSHAARGVWVDMLCLMFECSPRGVLATGGVPWSRDDVAAAVGGNVDVALRCIDECVAKGVCKVRSDGALFSKRMVEDETVRTATRERVGRYRKKQNGNTSVTRPYEEEDEGEDRNRSNTQDHQKQNQAARAGEAGLLALGDGDALPLVMGTSPEQDPVHSMFPTVGKLREWPLRSSKLAEWRVAFPGVNIEAEVVRARQWCVDNREQRKTAAGMPRFLFTWLSRAQNSCGNANVTRPDKYAAAFA